MTRLDEQTVEPASGNSGSLRGVKRRFSDKNRKREFHHGSRQQKA